MTVERNEDMPDEDPERQILNGTYVMLPVRVGVDEGAKQSHFCPAQDGPYQPETLGAWARIHYFRQTGIFPQNTQIKENSDGTFSICLYERAEPDGIQSDDPSARYTVDAYGEGKNEITGVPVSLMR